MIKNTLLNYYCLNTVKSSGVVTEELLYLISNRLN